MKTRIRTALFAIALACASTLTRADGEPVDTQTVLEDSISKANRVACARVIDERGNTFQIPSIAKESEIQALSQHFRVTSERKVTEADRSAGYFQIVFSEDMKPILTITVIGRSSIVCPELRPGYVIDVDEQALNPLWHRLAVAASQVKDGGGLPRPPTRSSDQ
jgi:hypothetical protein